MTRSIHSFAHSRGLQLAALLAWLLLAVTPAFGMPAGMAGDTHDHEHATTLTAKVAHGDYAPPANTDHSCCDSHDGGGVGHSCECAAACGNVAALTVTREFAPALFASVSWTLFSTRVPGSNSTPPLRPPAA